MTETVKVDKNEEKKEDRLSKEIEDQDEAPEQETELEKYWRAVKENPQDFTGWTYLLQFVEQEVSGCMQTT